MLETANRLRKARQARQVVPKKRWWCERLGRMTRSERVGECVNEWSQIQSDGPRTRRNI